MSGEEMLPVAPARITATGFTPAAETWMRSGRRGAGGGCDGIFAVTDGLALGAY